MGAQSLKQSELGLELSESSSLNIVGVDEVGRGPLIGNVVAAAVILDPNCDLPLNDSKKLSEKKRQWLSEEIKSQALDYQIAFATPEEIDQLNILQATFLAMRRAINGLSQAFDLVQVDGNKCPQIRQNCQAIVKGDGKVPEISAASILAKVARDREMILLDEQYPEYGFASHKGYPTKMHLDKISKLGLIPGYRKSFKPVQTILQLTHK